jgi:hypothetical protein
MDDTMFDRFTRRVGRRTNRRHAVAAGSLGLSAALLHGLAPSTQAQEATPITAQGATVETDPAGAIDYLFVQVATGGTWTPKPGAAGTWLLTLTGTSAHTIYFSDRPARIVGALPTQDMLTSLGFTPDFAPNAAVVTGGVTNEEGVLIVELFNPIYDPATATLTYEARVLADYDGGDLAPLAARQGDGSFPTRSGRSACSSMMRTVPTLTHVDCMLGTNQTVYTYRRSGGVLRGSGGRVGRAFPCEGSTNGDGTQLETYWTDKCNADVAACNNACSAEVYGG